MDDTHFTLVVIGTGFASSFFLNEYLKHADKNIRILVLERGDDLSYAWKLNNKSNSNIHFDTLINNITPQKAWVQNIAFGGGSCWTGNSPRMHPSDFNTYSQHNVGVDWPFSYEELEPYYFEAETIMNIAGATNNYYPRKNPYPLKPHSFNAFDKLIFDKYPEHFMAMPSARASEANNSRPKCCNNGVCSICPIGAKFQIDLHMRHIYNDPRVTLKTSSNVRAVEIESNTVTGVHYQQNNQDHFVRTEHAAIGAHAIMTPQILLQSGLDDYALGKFLNEQISVDVRVHLDGIDSFDGSQRVTGLGNMFLNETTRADFAGCSVESYNIPWLRAEFNKWRQVGFLKFVFEDIPNENNSVTLGKDSKPVVKYKKHSDYLSKGLQSLPSRVEQLLNSLPIEEYTILKKSDLGGSAHIHGTTRMGVSPTDSVVDPDLIHHSVRNLSILGSGVFPTCPTANPTLTLSALSIRAARQLMK